jgi:DNA-binding NarL/FixJ family response regulator
MLMLSCKSSILRILVVDDHELTRLTLQLVFSCQENIQVIGLASNGLEAVEMVKRHQPDVIVLDLQMPVMDGWSASGHIKAISPETQIIAYSSLEDAKLLEKKAMSNLDAFCKKDVPTRELIDLVKQLGQRASRSSVAQYINPVGNRTTDT